MFPSFHTLSSLFVHFSRPSFLALRGKVFLFSSSHYPWLLSSYINPAPVDWVPQGFFLFFPPLVRGPRRHPAAACLTGSVCKELSAHGRRGALS